ncbi:hypothetical protein HY994_03340 [Candidatus Micrarchaeota archaeon]|nr:hypothetical protein [Candidatus Micrarchaeota archaeon]
MPFLLATVCSDVEHAKSQVRKAQGAAYKNDAAWSVYSESPAVHAWIKAYAQNIEYPIFLSCPENVPNAPAFTGPNGGYNVALAIAYQYEQNVILLDDAELTPDAVEKLAGVDAEALQGACTGAVDDPLFWQLAVQQVLKSLAAGVVSPAFAAKQLQAALEGTLQSDKPWTCHHALSISANSIDNAALSPYGTRPLDLYANTAYFFKVRVLEPHFAWTRHEPAATSNAERFLQEWDQYQKTEIRLRVLDYIIEKTRMRTVSDFLIDEALSNAYYAPKSAISQEQYEQILSLKHPSLSLAYAKLTRPPELPEKQAMRRIIKTFLAAQTDWKDCLRSFGEQGIDEKLRVNKAKL